MSTETRGTGRITRELDPVIRRIVFDQASADDVLAELRLISEVDLAHLVMLREEGILTAAKSAPLLHEIGRLRLSDFAALAPLPRPRGTYLMYESYLTETLGSSVAGCLHTARSRNDLNATVQLLRLRGPVSRLGEETLHLSDVLLDQAARYAEVPMPSFTHWQPAQPTTFGYYLAGIAASLSRDLDGILGATVGMQRSPLGAGAVAGTTWPINPLRTCQLLGFTTPVLHAQDAVASRDAILRLLAACSFLGVTLSRQACDFLFWLSPEAGYLSLPDECAGSSSMMPQKRNPFVLEHIQGKAAHVLGAFTAAQSAVMSKPFSNSIAVGTEAVKPVWSALDQITDAVILAGVMARGVKPNPDRMLRQAEVSVTAATEIANVLVRQGLDFRRAHAMVGSAISEAELHGDLRTSTVVQHLPLEWRPTQPDDLSVPAIAKRTRYGGGPGAVDVICRTLARRLKRGARCFDRMARSWTSAHAELEAAVQTMDQGYDPNP